MKGYNKLILGTVQMGISYGISNSLGKISDEDSVDILNYAYKNRIRYLDTAEAYGTAHNIIGQYHMLNPKSRFKIITKLPHEFCESIGDKVNRYLDELNVSNLYALLFHSFTSYKQNICQLEFLQNLKSEKIIEKIGVSAYTNEELEVIINDENIDIIQLPYNVFDNFNSRKDILRKAKERGKIIHTRSCFLQGLFFMPRESSHPVVKKLGQELNLLNSISGRSGLSLSKITLAYCVAQPLIDNVLIGVDSMDQLTQNIEDSKSTLPSSIIQEIDSINISNKDLLNPSLWNQIKH